MVADLLAEEGGLLHRRLLVGLVLLDQLLRVGNLVLNLLLVLLELRTALPALGKTRCRNKQRPRQKECAKGYNTASIFENLHTQKYNLQK